MADGWGPSGAGTALDASVAAYPWIKLHVGSPGAAGTANPAVETTRQQSSWNATGADGITETSADLTWTGVGGSEDYTHFTAWSASTSGNFGFSGSITASAVTSGDDFTVSAGGLAVSVPLAS